MSLCGTAESHALHHETKGQYRTLFTPRSCSRFAPALPLARRRFSRDSVGSTCIAGEAPDLIHHAENDAIDPVIHGAVRHDTQNAPLSIVVLHVQLLGLYLLDDIKHVLLQTSHVELKSEPWHGAAYIA